MLVTFLQMPVVAQQEDRATLTGRVTDGSGGALPGVTVTITGTTAGLAPVTVVTDGVGQYVSPPLLPGPYAVAFTLTGFAPESRAGITLRPTDVVLVDA